MSGDRLTKHIHDNYYTLDEKIGSLAIMKLGKIEDIEEKIGTSLEERATPKKPLHEVMLFCDEYIETRLCPNCNENLPFKCNYCMDCGQSLDWGDEE